MHVVLSILILAANPAAPMEARPADAVQVFHCGFEEDWDADYDGWPDRWTRKRGAGYPSYLPVEVAPLAAPEGSHALRIALNGGAAVVFSPPTEIGSLFSYLLEVSVKTSGLQKDRAWCSVTFFDARGAELETFESERVNTADEWIRLRIGPMIPSSDKVHTAVVGLHLEPTAAGADIRGGAQFDDVWLGRLPRMTVGTNREDSVYTSQDPVEITCNMSGIFDREPVVTFEMRDIAGQTVARHESGLQRDASAQPKAMRPSLLSGNEVAQSAGFSGSTRWTPNINQPGFYRVHVTMQGPSSAAVARQLSLVVLEPRPNPPQGEFGWTLSRGDKPLGLTSLARLLPLAGINWVKFPVWVDEQETGQLDQLVWFAERLSAQGIESVGLLHNPPKEVRPQFGDTDVLTAADIFSTEPQLWYPSLEPAMTRLALQVRWWQLGLDEDSSFVGYPNLVATIAKVKKQLQRFGQEVHLGIPWRLFNETLDEAVPPWEFLALSASPSLTQQELREYLPAIDPKHAKRWVAIEPLPAGEYSVEVRASDLIHRMVAAKMQGAEAIFATDPFSPRHGLMNEDGTPGELFLPWRTTALALANTEYLGSLRLPGGSQNHLFSRAGQTVMVVWNDRSVEEPIYLGENVRQVDAWGRGRPAVNDQGEPMLRVGPVPSFVLGVNGPIVRWSLAVAFQESKLPSLFGRPHTNGFAMKNFFPQGVEGQVRLVAPDDWKVYPRVTGLKLAAGEEHLQPFAVTLPFDANSGPQPVRLDFDINADRRYQFSVYRQLEVGLDDLKLEASTRLNENGELEVEQRLDNHGVDPVSFKCFLFAPNRRRMVTQVIRLGQDRDTKTYRVPHGAELIGQTLWLRAEEIGGQRILNYRFMVEE